MILTLRLSALISAYLRTASLHTVRCLLLGLIIVWTEGFATVPPCSMFADSISVLLITLNLRLLLSKVTQGSLGFSSIATHSAHTHKHFVAWRFLSFAPRNWLMWSRQFRRLCLNILRFRYSFLLRYLMENQKARIVSVIKVKFLLQNLGGKSHNVGTAKKCIRSTWSCHFNEKVLLRFSPCRQTKKKVLLLAEQSFALLAKHPKKLQHVTTLTREWGKRKVKSVGEGGWANKSAESCLTY